MDIDLHHELNLKWVKCATLISMFNVQKFNDNPLQLSHVCRIEFRSVMITRNARENARFFWHT